MSRKRARRTSPFKHTIFFVGILLVLCVAVVSFARFAESERDRNNIPNDGVQSTVESLTSNPPERGLPTLPTSEPSTVTQSASK